MKTCRENFLIRSVKKNIVDKNNEAQDGPDPGWQGAVSRLT